MWTGSRPNQRGVATFESFCWSQTSTQSGAWWAQALFFPRCLSMYTEKQQDVTWWGNTTLRALWIRTKTSSSCLLFVPFQHSSHKQYLYPICVDYYVGESHNANYSGGGRSTRKKLVRKARHTVGAGKNASQMPNNVPCLYNSEPCWNYARWNWWHPKNMLTSPKTRKAQTHTCSRTRIHTHTCTLHTHTHTQTHSLTHTHTHTHRQSHIHTQT
jgi:hypothetical protein